MADPTKVPAAASGLRSRWAKLDTDGKVCVVIVAPILLPLMLPIYVLLRGAFAISALLDGDDDGEA